MEGSVDSKELAKLRKRIAELEAAVLAAKCLIEQKSDPEDVWQILDQAYHQWKT